MDGRMNGTEMISPTEGTRSSGADRFLQVLADEKALCESRQSAYYLENNSSRENFCPPVWDQLMCWPETKAGKIATQPCPSYVVAFNHHQFTSRLCNEDGEWFTSTETNTTWTNYTLCTSSADQPQIFLEWLPVIKTMSRLGYAVSFTSLAFALVALVSMKRLRCPRNTLHIHLFFSFLLRAFMALLKDLLFVDGVGLPTSIFDDTGFGPLVKSGAANWECKLVISLWQYFILANYTWILMEGMYLHNLIFLALFTDSSAITAYIILGWGCPFAVVFGWVMARIFVDDSLCWTTHTNNHHLFLIIRIPIIISVILNFIFFVNIVRVLLLKLTSSVSVETRKYRYRKWAKSTLVLVPLFGVHYSLFMGMTYFARNPVVEVVWLFCDLLFASFQGFFVSLLYCLLNAEVRSEIKKILRDKGWCKRGEGSSSLSMHAIAIARSTHEEILTTNGMTMT